MKEIDRRTSLDNYINRQIQKVRHLNNKNRKRFLYFLDAGLETMRKVDIINTYKIDNMIKDNELHLDITVKIFENSEPETAHYVINSETINQNKKIKDDNKRKLKIERQNAKVLTKTSDKNKFNSNRLQRRIQAANEWREFREKDRWRSISLKNADKLPIIKEIKEDITRKKVIKKVVNNAENGWAGYYIQ